MTLSDFIIVYTIFMIIVEIILIKKAKSDSLSKSDQKKYNKIFQSEEAALQTAITEYNQKMKISQEAANIAKAQRNRENSNKIQDLQNELKDALKNLDEAKKVLDNDTTLSWKDKNEDTVNYLIEMIGSKRADSIKEALNMYDVKVAADNRERKTERERISKMESDRWRQDYESRKREQEEMRRSQELMEINSKLNAFREDWNELTGRMDD